MIEALELRLTPASFFLGSDGAVVDSHGDTVGQYTSNGAEDWAGKLSQIGADAAFLFKKGDTLSIDTNGNGRFDKGDQLLLKVSGGAAVFFLSTSDGGGVEIDGISASDKFGGIVNAVVGGIVTNLAKSGSGKNASYEFSGVQDAEIRGLTVNGYLSGEGGIVAGGGVVGLKITGADASTNLSAAMLAVGNSTGDFARMGDLEIPGFVTRAGETGASIAKVSAVGGITEIYAGSGGAGGEGSGKPGGKGGSIRDITIGAGGEFCMITAGSGGTGSFDKGGAGGEIRNISISGIDGQRIYISSGNGEGGTAGSGTGGNVSNISLCGVDARLVQITSGTGGSGNRGGADAGDITQIDSDIAHVDWLNIYAGQGGTAFPSENGKPANGGDAGSISKVFVLRAEEIKGNLFTSRNSIDQVTIETGSGGDGAGTGNGGDGGSISDIYVPVASNLEIKAGDGGSAEELQGTLKKVGNAGDGGGLYNIVALAQEGSESAPDFSLRAGHAGAGHKAAGGGIADVLIASWEQGAGDIQILAGQGSAGLEYSGESGGDGGDVSNVTVSLPEIERMMLASGQGGYGTAHDWTTPKASSTGGSGGHGGSVDSIRIFSNDADMVGIYGGGGGTAAGGTGGGNGGFVNDILLTGLTREGQQEPGVFGEVGILAGNGGQANAPYEKPVKGGDGGNISNVWGPAFNTFENLGIHVGSGGQGNREELFGKSGHEKNVDISQS